MTAPLQTSYESNSAEIVSARMARGTERELAEALAILVRCLHEAVREIRPMGAQWRSAVSFLTEVGHASDERRQEWVLLSDLLGVTQLIEEINGQHPKGATPNTSRGPFYRADAPQLESGASISLDGVGEPLAVTSHVRDLDGNPVAGAIVETWQANGAGWYENQQPDHQPEFNLRGLFRTNQDGDLTYRTVKPRGYRVPDDGPLGQLLGRLGYPLERPAHISFIVRALGYKTLITQVYDGSDPHLADDALFGVKPELVGNFNCELSDSGQSQWSLDCTFIMTRAARNRR